MKSADELSDLFSKDVQAMYRRIKAVAEGELTELPQAQNIYRQARFREQALQEAYLALVNTLDRAGEAIAANWTATE